MGVSTDAMLYFGFQIGEEDDPPKWLLDPDEDDRAMYFDEFVTKEAQMDDAEYSEQRAVIDAYPVDVHFHCSYEYPIYLLCVRGAEHKVSRGYTKAIDPSSLAVPAEKIAAFRQWCEDREIPYEEPKWLLCSLWG